MGPVRQKHKGDMELHFPVVNACHDDRERHYSACEGSADHVVEFTQTATATAIGFVAMGLVGYFVKLIHIPINNILIGA